MIVPPRPFYITFNSTDAIFNFSRPALDASAFETLPYQIFTAPCSPRSMARCQQLRILLEPRREFSCLKLSLCYKYHSNQSLISLQHSFLFSAHTLNLFSQLTRALTNTKSLSDDTFILFVSLHKPLLFIFLYTLPFFVSFPPRLFFHLFIFLTHPSLSQEWVDSLIWQTLRREQRVLELCIGFFQERSLGTVRRESGTKKVRGRSGNPNDCLIEGGMRIPMGTVTKDYLRAHRLAHTQCAPNMFRVLGNVGALNERMGLGLTYHDINWVYNLHHLKG